MKVMITGAHITPALAVIEELKKISNVDIVYVGRKTTLEGDKTQSIESQVLPRIDVKFISLITGRLQRTFTFYTIPSLLKIPVGFFQSFFILLTQKPDVILSFGGYVAVPIVIVGWLLSIPIIIHEQTLISGLANKISFHFASKIALSFKQNNLIGGKITLTGNPLRKEILRPEKKISTEYIQLFENSKRDNLPVILVMGGNQGSHTLNKALEQSLNKLLSLVSVIHVSGDNKFNDFERLQKLTESEELKKIRKRYIVKRWIGDDIGAILSKVDFVVSRAGANTLCELAYMGTPALVIPFEPLYNDEQNKNAKYFEKTGLVQILSQAKLSPHTLFSNIKEILKNLEKLKEKAKYAKKIIIPDAAKRLALETLLLV